MPSNYTEKNTRNTSWKNRVPQATSNRIQKIIDDHQDVFLEHEEFCKVWKKWKKSGSAELLAQMVISHEALCIKPASFYHELSPELCLMDDLLSEGKNAIIQAIRTYDPDRGIWFWQYAKPGVWRRIHTIFNRLKFGFVHHHTKDIHGSNHKRNDIKLPLSIDAQIAKDGADDDDSKNASILETLGEEDEGIREYIAQDSYEGLTSILDPKEKELIDWHFKDEKLWTDYADKLGVSKQVIDSRRNTIIRKLRRHVKRLGILPLGGERDPRVTGIDDDREGFGYGTIEYREKYYQKHKAKVQKYQREYYHKHRDNILKRRKELRRRKK